MIDISCIICKCCSLRLGEALLAPVQGILQENVIACKNTIIMFTINTTAITDDCKLVFNMINYIQKCF